MVVTRHSGIPEMVRGDKEALFVPPRAPEAIAEAVQQFSSEAVWQAASRHARDRFQTRFSPEAVRRLWVDLVERG